MEKYYKKIIWEKLKDVHNIKFLQQICTIILRHKESAAD